MVHSPGTAPTRAGMVPLVMEIVCVPAFATRLNDGFPVQVVLALGVGAMITLFGAEPGSRSVNETLTSGEVLLFCRVMVNVDRPFTLTVVG